MTTEININMTKSTGVTLNTKDKFVDNNIKVTPVLQTKTVTGNGEVIPDSGNCGLSQVTVNIPEYNNESEEISSTATLTFNIQYNTWSVNQHNSIDFSGYDNSNFIKYPNVGTYQIAIGETIYLICDCDSTNGQMCSLYINETPTYWISFNHGQYNCEYLGYVLTVNSEMTNISITTDANYNILITY